MSEDRKYKGETFTGRIYWEDKDGNREYEDETWTGRKYREDSDGKRTYEDEIEAGETWTGREYEEKKSGCYLTTACITYAGLTEDCHELRVLRSFRDIYVVNLPNGQSILEKCYSHAPIILKKIMESTEKEMVLSGIYATIQQAVHFIESEENIKAFKCYEDMYQYLSVKFKNEG